MAVVGVLTLAVVAWCLWSRRPSPAHASGGEAFRFEGEPREGEVEAFLVSLETHIRRLAAMDPQPPEVQRFLKALREDHAIHELREDISTYSDGLLERYILGEPMGAEDDVQVWETVWLRGDDVIYKGELRRATSRRHDHETGTAGIDYRSGRAGNNMQGGGRNK